MTVRLTLVQRQLCLKRLVSEPKGKPGLVNEAGGVGGYLDDTCLLLLKRMMVTIAPQQPPHFLAMKSPRNINSINTAEDIAFIPLDFHSCLLGLVEEALIFS